LRWVGPVALVVCGRAFGSVADLSSGRAGDGLNGKMPRLCWMIVRRAGAADVAVLAELRGIDGDQLGAYAGWVAAHAETHLPFVAEVDGYVVGAGWLLVAERVPSGRSLDRWFGDVQSVKVRQEFRDRGVGGALMAAILAEARVRGLEHVTVHSSRRAVDFYLRNGFSHHRQFLFWEPAAS
jgi:GNAT superfamily N-acetyltransferase